MSKCTHARCRRAGNPRPNPRGIGWLTLHHCPDCGPFEALTINRYSVSAIEYHRIESMARVREFRARQSA